MGKDKYVNILETNVKTESCARIHKNLINIERKKTRGCENCTHLQTSDF